MQGLFPAFLPARAHQQLSRAIKSFGNKPKQHPIKLIAGKIKQPFDIPNSPAYQTV
jgi:hypothetical protein